MTDFRDDSLVSVAAGSGSYAGASALFTECLALLPLPSDFIRPGETVVLKPNWVKEWDERRPGPGSWEHVVTHPAVVEAAARWAATRLGTSGRVIICDAPQTDSSFDRLREYCGLDALVDRCRAEFPSITFDLLDLRPEEWTARDGVTVARRELPGDPLGAATVKLNEASEFVGFGGEGRLYGASYDMAETNAHHHGEVHEYQLCRTPMCADVLINLPKLKTHKKVGVTCSLKNLVGINANKNWLPHHTEGNPTSGGDQFPAATAKTRLEGGVMGFLKSRLKKNLLLSRLFVPLKGIGRLVFGDTSTIVRSGNWHGNNTCWRMVLDLNKSFFFFDGNGEPRPKPMRYLTVVDGIVAGEGNGPMAPDPKPCGVLLAGRNPVAVDCAAATLMGFDWRKIRLLFNAFACRQKPLVRFTEDQINVVSNQPQWTGPLSEMTDVFQFKPHFGWVGAIEKEGGPA